MNVRTNAAAFMLALGIVGTTNANAFTINASGNYGAGGYAVVPFTVATSGVVDMTYNGLYDSTYSLFDASGAHLITNDDANSSYFPHLTQVLSAGSYSLLVSNCCASWNYAISGAAISSTDGFNYGSYAIGGYANLGAMQNYLDTYNYGSFAPYAVTITVAVPEPTTYFMILAGLGLVGSVAWRRKQAEAELVKLA